MPKRKERLRAVFDTNVVVRHFIGYRKGQKENYNRRVFELWFIKNQIQLVVSPEIIEEFLETMRSVLAVSDESLKRWDGRFLKHRADVVSLGKRFTFSRDPRDNIFLAVADTGKADFLITNDRDLLDISDEDKRKLKFKIVTPKQFLDYWKTSS
ncbi:MAG TPA: putative toxin-antitoxin system toxin component, PIN family [Blastocatellia bacterium]